MKRDSESSLESLFHRLDFEVPLVDENAPPPPWYAKASHGSPEMYEVRYMFFFKGVDVEKWKIEYEVKGPRKDCSI